VASLRADFFRFNHRRRALLARWICAKWENRSGCFAFICCVRRAKVCGMASAYYILCIGDAERNPRRACYAKHTLDLSAERGEQLLTITFELAFAIFRLPMRARLSASRLSALFISSLFDSICSCNDLYLGNFYGKRLCTMFEIFQLLN
jgi:hypothetical protein